MGKLFIKHYELKNDSIYTCKNCGCHLALASKIISKEFRGTSGPAFLFDNCVNVVKHAAERRELATGMHTVANITCISCDVYLGWYYYDAEHPSQEYKIDKFILECTFITKVSPESSSPIRRVNRGSSISTSQRAIRTVVV